MPRGPSRGAVAQGAGTSQRSGARAGALGLALENFIDTLLRQLIVQIVVHRLGRPKARETLDHQLAHGPEATSVQREETVYEGVRVHWRIVAPCSTNQSALEGGLTIFSQAVVARGHARPAQSNAWPWAGDTD